MQGHVLVTGAGTGIGKAIAHRLSRDGATLTLLARDLGRLEATAAEVGGALVASCDIRDQAAVDAAVEAAVATNGPLVAAIANSGVGGANAAGPDDRFEELVSTNLMGTYHTLRAAERHLAKDGPRSLIAVSSILSRIGVPGYTGYCASKAGVLGLVRALAMELAPRQVQVNAVCPGWVDTAMAHEGLDGIAAGLGISKDEAYAMAMRDVPLGRMGRPEEVAGMVAWLLGPDGRGVTGQALDMNGGAWMG